MAACHSSYLFGTVHAGKPQSIPFTAFVSSCFMMVIRHAGDNAAAAAQHLLLHSNCTASLHLLSRRTY